MVQAEGDLFFDADEALLSADARSRSGSLQASPMSSPVAGEGRFFSCWACYALLWSVVLLGFWKPAGVAVELTVGR